MKVFFIVSVGRQIEGEAISIKFEKGYTKASKADAYIKESSRVYTENMQTEEGLVEFYCERRIHELEIEK